MSQTIEAQTGLGFSKAVFAREPVAWVGAVEAMVAVVVAFGVLNVTSAQAGLANAVVSALAAFIVAVRTNDAVGAAFVQLLKAALALGVGFGLDLSPGQTGALIACASVVVSLILRQQVSPVDSSGDVVPAAILPTTQVHGNAYSRG